MSGVGNRGSSIRHKDDGRREYHKRGKMREKVRHFPGFGAVACARLEVPADCSAVIGIFLRDSMYYLIPTTSGSMPCCLPVLSGFLLASAATLWRVEDHEFSRLSSSQKWTEDREEGYRLEVEHDFFYLPFFPLSVLYCLDRAGNMCWALVGSWKRRASRKQRQVRRQHDRSASSCKVCSVLKVLGYVSYLLTQLKWTVSH